MTLFGGNSDHSTLLNIDIVKSGKGRGHQDGDMNIVITRLLISGLIENFIGLKIFNMIRNIIALLSSIRVLHNLV